MMMNKAIYYNVDSFIQITKIVEFLEDGHNVIVECEPVLQKRVIDYLSGVIYVLKGQIIRITANKYLLIVDKGE